MLVLGPAWPADVFCLPDPVEASTMPTTVCRQKSLEDSHTHMPAPPPRRKVCGYSLQPSVSLENFWSIFKTVDMRALPAKPFLT